MYRLRTLGGSDLRSTDDGRHLQSVLAQPKRFALLVYLAVERPGGFTRRDVLLDLFWPEFEQARARAALRKSLHYLRSSLGGQVLIRRGDEEVGIDRDRLWCDVPAFEEALEAGRLEEALDLYGGTFLPGFHLGGPSGFERWMERRRTRLRREAGRASLGLAERAEADGSSREVVRWARRALELDPYDEIALRRLLVAFDRTGNRAEAVRVFEEFSELLASELETEPSPESRALVQRIRSRDAPRSGRADGGRPQVGATAAEERGGVRRSAVTERSGDVGRAARADAPLVGDRPGSRAVAAAAGALVAAACLFYLLGGVTTQEAASGGKEGRVDPVRVLVADFDAVGADTLLAEALSEALRIGLAQAPAVSVTSRSTVADALVRMRRDPSERLTSESAREVAIREGIATVVGGQVRRAGTGYVISARLMDAESGEVLDGWLETPADSSRLTPAIERLAGALRDRVGPAVASEVSGDPSLLIAADPRLEHLTTPSLPALQKYVQACRVHLGGDFVRAARLFEEAIALDSTFAGAHAGLAMALSVVYASRGRELEALSNAFRLRGRLTDVERYRIAGSYHRAVGDLPRAIEAFRSELDATGGRTGHFWLGLAMLQAGELEESERAFREGRAARQVFGHEEMLIRLLHRTGRREEATDLLAEAEDLYPEHPIFAESRVELAAASGAYERADSLSRLVPLAAGMGLAERHPLRHRAVLAAIRGRFREALRRLEELRELQLAREMREPALNTAVFAGRLHLASGDTLSGVAEVERMLARVPPDSLHPLGRPYVLLPLADFFAEAGRAERARALLAAHDREVRPEFRRPGRARRHLVEAKVEMAEGRTDRALAELSRALAEVRIHGQFDLDLPIQVPLADRPEVARLYAAAGERDSSIAAYERYLENRSLRRAWLDAYELGPALGRLAALYEAEGRAGNASRLRRRLAELWDGAERQVRTAAEMSGRSEGRLPPGIR